MTHYGRNIAYESIQEHKTTYKNITEHYRVAHEHMSEQKSTSQRATPYHITSHHTFHHIDASHHIAYFVSVCHGAFVFELSEVEFVDVLQKNSFDDKDVFLDQERRLGDSRHQGTAIVSTETWRIWRREHLQARTSRINFTHHMKPRQVQTQWVMTDWKLFLDSVGGWCISVFSWWKEVFLGNSVNVRDLSLLQSFRCDSFLITSWEYSVCQTQESFRQYRDWKI